MKGVEEFPYSFKMIDCKGGNDICRGRPRSCEARREIRVEQIYLLWVREE